MIEGALRYPMPIVLGHEAAGIVEQAGPAARGVKAGDQEIDDGFAALKRGETIRSVVMFD